MLMRKPKYRRFEYQPRYYDPEKDEREKRKKRLKFRYARRTKPRKTNQFIYIGVFILALYVYLKLSGYL